MATIKLGAESEILEQEMLIGTHFSINENGGMGGGHIDFYAEGNPSDYVKSADKNGMVHVVGVNGWEKYINLGWCNELTRINIVRVVVPQTGWNQKYGSECRHFRTGKKITIYVDLGIENDFEITHNSSSVTLAVDNCHTIYVSKPF